MDLNWDESPHSQHGSSDFLWVKRAPSPSQEEEETQGEADRKTEKLKKADTSDQAARDSRDVKKGFRGDHSHTISLAGRKDLESHRHKDSFRNDDKSGTNACKSRTVTGSNVGGTSSRRHSINHNSIRRISESSSREKSSGHRSIIRSAIHRTDQSRSEGIRIHHESSKCWNNKSNYNTTRSSSQKRRHRRIRSRERGVSNTKNSKRNSKNRKKEKARAITSRSSPSGIRGPGDQDPDSEKVIPTKQHKSKRGPESCGIKCEAEDNVHKSWTKRSKTRIRKNRKSRSGKVERESRSGTEKWKTNEHKNSKGNRSSSGNSSDDRPHCIIPEGSLKDVHFSDYDHGSYERVAQLRRKWLRRHWSFLSDFPFLDECTPSLFCQCYRPSKMAEMLGKMRIPVLYPSHLSQLKTVAEQKDFNITFYGRTVHMTDENDDFLVTYHDPQLLMHNVPPLLTHALSLKINKVKGVEELVGVDVEQVAVVTRYAGCTLRHYTQHAELSALERLNILLQVIKSAHRIHQNNYVHNNLNPSSVCLELTGMCPVTKMWSFQVSLIDLTLCQQQRSQVFSKPCNNVDNYQWISPEVLRGDRCSEYSDVYSIGKLAATLETHRHPYPGELKTWIAEATDIRSLARPPLRRGFRYIKRFLSELTLQGNVTTKN